MGRVGYRAADAFTCSDILSLKIVGRVWSAFKPAARRLVDGYTDLLILYGFYGAGKTLFAKRFHADWGFVERQDTLVAYVPLRGLVEEKQALFDELPGRGLLHVAARYTIELIERRRLCGDQQLVDELKKLAGLAREYKQSAGVALADVMDRVSQRLQRRVILVIDEIEQLILGALRSGERAVTHEYLVSELVSVFERLYELLNGGHSFGLFLTSTYRLTSLAYESALAALQLRCTRKSTNVDGLIDKLKQLAVTLSDYVEAPGRGLATLLEELESGELCSKSMESEELQRFARLGLETQYAVLRVQLGGVRTVIDGESLEPGFSGRGSQSIIDLNYSVDDYRQLIETMGLRFLERFGEAFIETIEANKVPPRLLQDFDVNIAAMRSRVAFYKKMLRHISDDRRIELRILGIDRALDLREITGLHHRRISARLRLVDELLSRLLESGKPMDMLRLRYDELIERLGRTRYVTLVSAYLLQPLTLGRDYVLGPPLYYPAVMRNGLNMAPPFMPRWSRFDDAFLVSLYAALTS